VSQTIGQKSSEIMAQDRTQKSSRSMTYPKKGTLNRLIFKGPLIWWRMGLGLILSHKAMAGNKMLVLTIWGRKSHKPRHTMLSYIVAGEKEYVCSGWGGNSDWYKNIAVNPQVTVQVGRKIYAAKARRVQDIDEFTTITRELFETGGDTHFKNWLESFGIEFNQQDMLEKRERLYLVAFDPSEEPGPPSMPVDLKWVWVVIATILVGAWLYIR
jgi:deazaflavin-dependent oxidoreductase (nitroreductase family)